MRVTREQLAKVMPNAGSRIDTYLPIINGWSDHFRINTPLRMAHYLAQIAHESGELRYTRELASGKAYEGRKDLGNTQQGDGVKFKGRGLIQITGRANYTAYMHYCKFDVVSNPELLERPLGAVKSSMWFWNLHGLNRLADADNIKAITYRINGGYNGLAERERYLLRAKEALAT